MEKKQSRIKRMSYKEKIKFFRFSSDSEIEENRELLRGLLNEWSSRRRDSISSWASRILGGDPRISRDAGAINRVLKAYSRSNVDNVEKELVNSINASLLLLFYRFSDLGWQAEIPAEIFTYYLAKRLNEVPIDENDFFELLKCQIMQDIINPIKSICEKTARLLKYTEGNENALNQIGGYWHLKNIYTILEYLLKNDAVSEKNIFRFDRNFFILSILIAEARNISIHGSSRGAESAKLAGESYDMERNKGENNFSCIDLTLDLQLKTTVGARLNAIAEDVEGYPHLNRNIANLLNIYDSSFLKEMSITEKDWGAGFTETSTQVISRIDETLNRIQVEVSKLMGALHSYVWNLFSVFCNYLDTSMHG